MQFFRRGKSGAILVPTISNTSAPTVAELTAGTPISAAVIGLTGFETALNRVNTPVMKYATELQTRGPKTLGEASITLMEDDGTGSDADSTERQDAFDALEEDSAYYLVLIPNKTTAPAATVVEIWKIQSGGQNRDWSLGADTARYTVPVAITAQPVKDAVVAA